MRIAPSIAISEEDRRTLQGWSRGRTTPARLVLRAKIVLLAAAGKFNKDIAAELETGMKTVCQWRSRFAKHGLAGIDPFIYWNIRSSNPVASFGLANRPTAQELLNGRLQ